MESVYDLMARLLTDHFGVPEEDVRPDATFEQIEIDSLARVELVSMLEDELRVILPDEYAEATLGEAAAYLERLSGRLDDAEAEAAAKAAAMAEADAERDAAVEAAAIRAGAVL
jgi:acyl carrier protein